MDATATRHVGTRLDRAKLAYTTRRVRLDQVTAVVADEICPSRGDLVLAQVTRLGHHKKLELQSGRRSTLFPGDEVLVCYGERYAPDQFEAEIPSDLGSCQLVAAGGIAGRAVARHDAVGDPTELQPIGLLADAQGRTVNLAGSALGPAAPDVRRPLTIAVLGTTMNAGKTTTAFSLIRGLTLAGRRVAAAKVTGTGAGGDVWLMEDAGAETVLDFTHAGLPSTAGASPQTVERIFSELTGHLAATSPDVIVLEVADGLRQTETAALLASPTFAAGVDGILFAAGDALGAVAGVQALRGLALPVVGVSGVLTRSPLAMREAQTATSLPILDAAALSDPARAGALARSLDAAPRAADISLARES